MNTQANNNVIRSQPCLDCYLCNARGQPLYQGLRDHLFGAPGEWNLKRCPNPECGLVWMDPMPIEEDIGKAYRVYYTHQEDIANDRDAGFKGLARSGLRAAYGLLLFATHIQKERTRRNIMYIDDTAPGKLLEVGCGDGSRLAEMRLLGWEVEGQEVDSKAAEHTRSAHGLKVHLGALKKASLPDNTFDAIIMNHVIEHVFDPVTLLAECRRILKPKGILVAVTPNIESLGHRHFVSSWRGLEPPRHLHLFSQRTLSRVAKNAGFSECETWTTAAKAGVVSLGSLDIKHDGRHKMNEPAKLRRGISAALYQLWACIVYMSDNGSGEECVLQVKKSA